MKHWKEALDELCRVRVLKKRLEQSTTTKLVLIIKSGKAIAKVLCGHRVVVFRKISISKWI